MREQRHLDGVPRREHGDHLKLRPNLIWHDGASIYA
jgi:hypothetical protein